MKAVTIFYIHFISSLSFEFLPMRFCSLPSMKFLLLYYLMTYTLSNQLPIIFPCLIQVIHECVLSLLGHVRLFATLWTVAHQVPLSMGFSRQEYWSGLPCPPLGDLPDPGTKPTSLTSPALAGGFFTTNTTWEAPLSKLEREHLNIGNFFQLEKTIHEIHLKTANLKI